MQIMRNIGLGLLVGSTLYSIGCGSAADVNDPSPTVSPASGTLKTTGETLLTSITIETGHTVDFYELADGTPFVGESGLEYQAPVLSGLPGSARSLAAIHKALRPTSAVPAALVASDERFAASRTAARAVVNEVPPPPADAPTSGAGPKLYNAGQQTWFKNTNCVDTDIRSLESCIQQLASANSGWIKGGVWSSQSMVGSEAAQAGTLNVYKWTGSQTLVLNVLVNPGTYYWTLFPGGSGDNGFNGTYTWYMAQLVNAGANTLVSQAVQACGENGERSCGVDCGSGQACDPSTTDGCQEDGTTNGTCFDI